MKRKTWIILGIVAGVVALPLIALPLLFNADAFRPTVQAQLRSALGRDVTIGQLRLSLLSGGVEADQISISDDPHFGDVPFLHAKSLTVGVELMPLILSRSLLVTGITLQEPEVTLLRATSGKWNFSSIGSDRASGTKASGSRSDFSIAKLKIVNGRITVGRVPSRGQPSTYENVNLVASNVSYSSAVPFTFDAKTPGGGKLKVEGTAGPIDPADTAASPLDAKVTIEHMDMASTGFLDPASGIAGILDYTGSVHSDGKTAHNEGLAKVSKVRVVRSGAPAKQPVSFDYASDFDLKRQSGVLNKGELHTGSSIVRLAGNYDTHGDSTMVRMKMTGAHLPVQDVEGLLPAFGVILPAGASLQGGTADANLLLDGPVDRLVTTGALNIANAKLAGFNLASKLAALSALTGMSSSSAETIIQTLSSNLRIAPDGIRADNLNIIVPGIGSMTGAGAISANNALNFRMVARLSNGGAGGVLSQLGGLNPLMRQTNGALPFLIQGTTSNPVFLPDVAGALTQGIPGPQNQGGLGGILGGLLGGKKK
jgi:AsmA protein